MVRPVVRLALLSALVAPSSLIAQGKISLPVSLGELEKRVVADSNDPAAHYNVALGYWNAKRWDDVDRSLRTAVALDPRFAQAHLALAYLPIARLPRFWDEYGDGSVPSKAIAEQIAAHNRAYRHAFLIDPLVDLRIMATVSQTGVDMHDLKLVFGETFAQYYQGRFDCYEAKYADCEMNFSKVILGLRANDVPDDAYWFRGIAAAHLQRYETAIDDFGALIRRDSLRVKKTGAKGMIRTPMRTNEYRYFLATFQHAAGNTAAAVPLYQEALAQDIGLYMGHVRLANIHEAQRDFPRAVEERRRAIHANPDDPTLLVDLGVTQGKSGAFADAAATLRAATAKLPRHTDAWFWLGVSEQQLGRTAEAKAAYQHVIAIAPSRFKPRADQARQRLAALP